MSRVYLLTWGSKRKAENDQAAESILKTVPFVSGWL